MIPPKNDLYPFTRSDEELRGLVFQIARRTREPFRQLVARLIGDELSEPEARERWASFVTHRRELAASLGRPVHLRVAALDLLALEGEPRKRPLVLSASAFEQLWAAATTDGLTGLANAQHFKALLAHELRQRAPPPFTLASLDLDGFKHVNDRHGHAAGDRALRGVAAALQRAARQGDVVGRLGGDEFAVLLIGSTLPHAKALATRVGEHLAPLLAETGMGLSFGFAQLKAGDTAETLLERADASMYRTKRARKTVAAAAPVRPVALYATGRPEAYLALRELFAQRGVLLAPAPNPAALEALRSLLRPALVLVNVLFPPRGGLATLEALGGGVGKALVVPRTGWRVRAALSSPVLSPDRADGVLTRVLAGLAPEPLPSLPPLASKGQAAEVMKVVSDLARGLRVAPARLAELASIAELDLIKRSLGS
ncbi:MAG: GGDEF domain-containing protein [Archangium sp.]|nr:GGDEF domain-containing protein [Archangium sp.]